MDYENCPADKQSQELDTFPASLEFLEKVEVIYKSFKGWNKPTTNAKTFEELPQEAREYVEVSNTNTTHGGRI